MASCACYCEEKGCDRCCYCDRSFSDKLTVKEMRMDGFGVVTKENLAKAWDRMRENTIIPKSTWPTSGETRPVGFQEMENYFELFFIELINVLKGK
jgi:hypothetical protein